MFWGKTIHCLASQHHLAPAAGPPSSTHALAHTRKYLSVTQFLPGSLLLKALPVVGRRKPLKSAQRQKGQRSHGLALLPFLSQKPHGLCCWPASVALPHPLLCRLASLASQGHVPLELQHVFCSVLTQCQLWRQFDMTFHLSFSQLTDSNSGNLQIFQKI